MYNGWKNYNTWAVNLWLNNEPGPYNMLRDIARESGGVDPKHAQVIAADRLKEIIQDNAPDLEPSMYSDLLAAALDDVDYYEIMGYVLEKLKEE